MSFESPIRINELAKEMGLTSKEIIEKLAQLSITGKTHSSTVTPDQIKRLKEFISHGSQVVVKKPKAFVVKKAKAVEVEEKPQEKVETVEEKKEPVKETPRVEVVKPRPVVNRLEIVRRAVPRPEGQDGARPDRRPARPQGDRKFPPRDGNRDGNREGRPFPPRGERGDRPARPFDKRSTQSREQRPENREQGDKKPIERRIIPQEMYDNKSGARKRPEPGPGNKKEN